MTNGKPYSKTPPKDQLLRMNKKKCFKITSYKDSFETTKPVLSDSGKIVENSSGAKQNQATF
jgi:hypothetical protein